MSKESHNQGQSDGAKNVYSPPDKNVFEFLIEGYSKEEIEDINDYDKGWDNGRKK